MESSECSSRSLATLLVVWVTAAMVASVLLRWKYMWIALAVLTLLFLIACGYATCINRQRTERHIVDGNTANIHQRRNIRSICSDVNNVSDNCSQTATEPPNYQPYWITDLPPSYAAAIGAPAPSTPSMTTATTTVAGIRLPLFQPRTSNPPPYSAIAIQPDQIITRPQSISQVQTLMEAGHQQYHDQHGSLESTNFSKISTKINSSDTQYRESK